MEIVAFFLELVAGMGLGIVGNTCLVVGNVGRKIYQLLVRVRSV